MKYAIIELPDDFEKGNCYNCPFQYYEVNGFDSCDSRCVFNYRYDECYLEINSEGFIEGDGNYEGNRASQVGTDEGGVMIISDCYSIREERNKIVIDLPQTIETMTNTLVGVSDRKVHLDASELTVILEIVKKMYEGEEK